MFDYLLLRVQIADSFTDAKQVAIEGRQPLARLDVEPLHLGLRLVDGRVKQLPFSLLCQTHKN